LSSNPYTGLADRIFEEKSRHIQAVQRNGYLIYFLAMESQNSLGTVLVTGGCGQLGSRLVRALLSEQTCSAVHVVSRNPTTNSHTNAKYHAGDLANPKQVAAILDRVKPKLIFHCSSPHYLAPDQCGSQYGISTKIDIAI
jgi:NAD(P)-dependent dehydrogenase (short-subunit alcohol dehydrogenase family)